jgi:hypothetical protein
MKNLILFLNLFLFIECIGQKNKNIAPFLPVEANFENRTVIIPKGFEYQVLFSEGDSVVNYLGQNAPAKGSHDMVVFIPKEDKSNHGYLYVSHESHKPNQLLGDGGGGSIMEIKQEKGHWNIIGKVHAIDFSTVGETFRNCGGTLTPHGTILTAEEEYPTSNIEINNRFGITDTSDYLGRKKYLNYGWMVEVDPISKKAIRKLYGMGRYPHEDVHCMSDGKTVYLTSDNKPAIFFKFVADKVGDYSSGQLFAYRQSDDGLGGSWISLPMNQDSLDNITEVSVRMGASMFISHEWIVLVNDKLYISESGSSRFDFDKEVSLGGKPALHLDSCCKKDDGKYKDPYGRILQFDLNDLKMNVYLHGGTDKDDSLLCFSSPDAMSSVLINNNYYLVISEDSHSGMNGKETSRVKKLGETYNEIYFLDLSIINPTLKDLKRFMMAPEGCETTGNYFTPDYKTHFVAIQHPSSKNPAPFNKSCVIAIKRY